MLFADVERPSSDGRGSKEAKEVVEKGLILSLTAGKWYKVSSMMRGHNVYSFQVKTFQAGSETLTVWNATYEEDGRQHQQHVEIQQQQVQTVTVTDVVTGADKENAMVQQQQQQRKRPALDAHGLPEDCSPSKRAPLSVDIPEGPEQVKDAPSHPFLPSHEDKVRNPKHLQCIKCAITYYIVGERPADHRGAAQP